MYTMHSSSVRPDNVTYMNLWKVRGAFTIPKCSFGVFVVLLVRIESCQRNILFLQGNLTKCFSLINDCKSCLISLQQR